MLLLAGILAPSLLLLRPSYNQLVGGGGGRLPLDRSVDALLQLPEQSSPSDNEVPLLARILREPPADSFVCSYSPSARSMCAS